MKILFIVPFGDLGGMIRFCGFDPGAVPIMVIDIKEPYLLSYSSMTCLQIFLSFLALDSPNVIILSSYFVVLQVCKTHIPAVRISDGQNMRVCLPISGCQEIKCFFQHYFSDIVSSVSLHMFFPTFLTKEGQNHY